LGIATLLLKPPVASDFLKLFYVGAQQNLKAE
jgi:hypothetical protein